MRSIHAIALLALMLAPTALATPPCTCDPNPITDLARCLSLDGDTDPRCPIVVKEPEDPAPAIKDLVDELDPRDWPCTCDPMPTPI